MSCARLRIWSPLTGILINARGLLGASVLLASLLNLCEGTGLAQQLALRRYDVSEGLAHGEVTSIYQDTKGFLWFSTFEGLSRFDGHRFVSYGVRDGLPHIIINDVRQDGHGRLWVATNGGGIALLNDRGSYPSAASRADQKFINFLLSDIPEANKVNRMLFDSRGALWCVTDFGIYRAAVSEQDLHFEPVIAHYSFDSAEALEDSQKRLWFGLSAEVIEVSEGQKVHRVTSSITNGERIRGIVEDGPNRLLIATSRGLFEYLPDLRINGRGSWRKLSFTLDQGEEILTMLRAHAGTLWLGTNKALVKYHGRQQVSYKTAQGLDVPRIRALTEDRDGNLWIGTVRAGVYELTNETIVSYTRATGLPQPVVSSVFEDEAGRINAVMGLSSQVVRITERGVIVNQKLKWVPRASSSVFVRQLGRRSWEVALFGAGLRFSEPILRLRNGGTLNVKQLVEPQQWSTGFQVFEDDNGSLWLLTGDRRLHRAQNPYTSILESTPTEFLPQQTKIVGDRHGGVWLGAVGRLGRIRDGQFRSIHPTEGLPETDPRSLFVDRRGWLWVGNRYQGASVTREPTAENPRFLSYTPEQHLSGGDVWSIAEDEFGRMYFGTTKGLDQFDPRTGQWLHYSREDGLPSNDIGHLYKDRRGYIWISTLLGLARFDPRAETAAKTPSSVYLSRVQVAGEDLKLPEAGAAQIEQVDLSPSRNNLLLEYVAPNFNSPETLRYQYKLEGVDSDWNVPTTQRSVNYARLGPGEYRFLVRAIETQGDVTTAPAILKFRILKPLWQRWWFLTLAASLVIASCYALYRYRVHQLLKVERMRTRIASDLHDDIGSSLSQISIISEVVRAQLSSENSSFTDPLSTIAQTSRELVDSMSDIVWAINPKRDNLQDLVHRMRHFAMDTLTAREVDIEFIAPDSLPGSKIDTDVRRDVFLIFKEAVNNAVRHSHGSKLWVELSVDYGGLQLTVEDNGRGFDTLKDHRGHGLLSLRQRASRIGGELNIVSTGGKGTTVNLRAPLTQRRRNLILKFPT